MRTLAIKNSKQGNDFNVVISDSALAEMEEYVKVNHPKTTVYIIYDQILGDKIDLLRKDTVFIPYPKTRSYRESAEEIKNWKTATQLVKNLFEYGMKKNDVVIAVGGGTVTDMAGFVSTLVYRGVSCIYCPTTISCSIDACIGGETGVNYGKRKNVIGTFRNPNAVFVDLNLLQSLSHEEVQSGLCTSIKHALICDEGFFHFIQENSNNIYEKNHETLEELIYKNLEIKRTFVTSDGLYNKKIALDLGQPFFDALVKHFEYNYEVALAMGLIIVCRVSNKLNLLSDEDLVKIDALLSSHFNLSIATGRPPKRDVDYLMKSIRRHKEVNIVLPVAIGNVEVHTVPIKLLNESLTSVFVDDGRF